LAPDPEAKAQLARLLADESLRAASEAGLVQAIDSNLARLVDGIVAEAAASDDVFDRDSALEFVRARVENLGRVLTASQASRLLESVQGKIEAW
jgi:hypothetical protein